MSQKIIFDIAGSPPPHLNISDPLGENIRIERKMDDIPRYTGPNFDETDESISIQINEENNIIIVGEGIYPGAVESEPFIRFAIEVGETIASGVIAAWLYDLLKNNDVYLQFRSPKWERIEESEEAIQRKLEEYYEQQDGSE